MRPGLPDLPERCRTDRRRVGEKRRGAIDNGGRVIANGAGDASKRAVRGARLEKGKCNGVCDATHMRIAEILSSDISVYRWIASCSCSISGPVAVPARAGGRLRWVSMHVPLRS